MDDTIPNVADLKFVTKKSMELAAKKEIILPSTYRVLFSLVAKKHNVDIGAEAFYSKEEIDERVYQQIASIDTNTDRAIRAIEDKDDIALKKVLDEVRMLKHEILSLKQIAYEDGLTKALNRKWFEENYLEAESETFKKSGVMVLIDLNDFKLINDTLGHAVGDKVLIHVAGMFKRYDVHVVRYGGDEFMLIFDNNSASEAKEIVNITREIHLKKTYHIVDNDLKILFGYGVGEFREGDGFADVITQLDQLLYEDKQRVKERTAK